MNTRQTKAELRASQDKAINFELRAERIARTFTEYLVDDIGRADFAKAVLLNLMEENPDICHSQDFCDASMSMRRAYAAVTGMDNVVLTHEQTCLWNRAWSIAKANWADSLGESIRRCLL